MQKISYFLTIVYLCSLIACSSNGSEGGSTTGSKGFTQTPSGLSYNIHTKNAGEKAKFGDFLTLQMQYTTMNDSTIFSSYNKPNPLSFKFQKTLFKGILNQGLTQMAAGDSATFYVPADSLYSNRLPKFLKAGDKLKYTISLQKIQSQAEYQAERNKAKAVRTAEDNKKIDAYLSGKSLKMETAASGLRYTIGTAGSGEKPRADQTVKMKYTTKLLDGTEVESSKGKAKDMPLNRQVRGLREGLMMLKKGGKATFLIPSTLAYGERQRGQIPGNSVLVYDVEVTDIADTAPPKSAPKKTTPPKPASSK
ncbi:MAG: FKBP-type peptidyl-prolyl cis-trans isomerase [Chitinophagales bacterium]